MSTRINAMVSRYGVDAVALAFAVVDDLAGFKSVDRPYSGRESASWDGRTALWLMKTDRHWYATLNVRDLEREVVAAGAHFGTHSRDFVVDASRCLRDPDFVGYYRGI